MRNGMNKLLTVTAVLACVCMWGCTDVDFRWEKVAVAEPLLVSLMILL